MTKERAIFAACPKNAVRSPTLRGTVKCDWRNGSRHRSHGASYFDIGTEAWNAATQTERLAANQHVLDIAIANRDTITLSVPFGKIAPNTFTGAEIRYLEAHGYRRVGVDALAPSMGGKPR